MKIGTILVATDFSDLANAAARHAVALARLADARVVLLHVSDPPFLLGDETHSMPQPGGIETEHWGEDRALEKLGEQAEEIGAHGVAVEVRLAEGKPALEIEKAAEELGADLLVVGTHGYRGAQRLLLGSVAVQVVRHVDTAMLTIPPDGLPTPLTNISRIVVATDFSPSAQRAVDHARFWASALSASVIVLHALDRPSTYEYDPLRLEFPPASEARKLADVLGQRAEDVARDLREEGIEATSLLAQGPAADTAAAVAEERGAGLIILGTRGYTPVSRLLLGSSADRLLRIAPCAVLTCPPPT